MEERCVAMSSNRQDQEYKAMADQDAILKAGEDYLSHRVEETEGIAPAGVNASGHTQELARNFNLLSLAGVGLVVGTVWPAVGGSILTAIFNGGPPGVLYEFIAVSVFYSTVAASVAELASAIPSSAGVYHWASVTPGPQHRHGWGRAGGFFAGWWNYLAWVLGAASMASIFANTVVQMYAVNHAGFEAQPWHVFITYIIATWLACALVCCANGAMPHLNTFGIFAVLVGFFITVIVVTVMPGHGGRPPHATSSFVWSEWSASLGYPDGFVFVAGMLNGAYSVGAVDSLTHLAEEIPDPERNVPIAIGLQFSIGVTTGICYLIAIMYAINNYDALFESSYPIAEIYRQATGSAAGATGLLAIIMVCIGLTVIGLYMTAGRTLWTLARDGATPYSDRLAYVNPRFGVPVASTVASACLVTVLGCIYVGSSTAFNAFVGSFILLIMSSYLAAILPNLATGRRNIRYGPFHMRGWLGFAINGIACAYMLVWFIIYSFPYSLPTDARSMNYASLIWGGLTLLFSLWWLVVARHGYQGPATTGGGGLSVEHGDRGVVPGIGEP
ncbi:amino acid/polyamine transporter I [Apiospora arundinis]